jgi:flagellar motor switch protein FliM
LGLLTQSPSRYPWLPFAGIGSDPQYPWGFPAWGPPLVHPPAPIRASDYYQAINNLRPFGPNAMAESAVLSQREIDALLNGDVANDATDEQASGSPGASAARKDSTAHRIKLYDFRHPEKLSKEQLRGLQMMQTGVSNAIATALSNRLRSPVESRLSALERGIFEEYAAQVGGTSVVSLIDMNPLSGYCVGAFGVDVAFGIIDRLLGGKGKKYRRALERDLTDIESTLVRHIALDLAGALIEPWSRVAELTPDVTELAVGSQLMHAIPPSEFVLTAWYEIRFGEQTGGVSLCFPLTILEQILPKLTGQSLFENRPNRAELVTEKIKDVQLMPMPVTVRALLGGASVPAMDLANLSEGDIIVLDREVEDPVRVMIGNCERFAGSPGTRGRKLALQVSGTIDDDGWVKPFARAE